MQIKKEHPIEKLILHPRNRHRKRYDFNLLIKCCPELANYVKLNDYEDESIDFFDPNAVKVLNKALLKQYYDIEFWDIPQKYLCPPIPGRADYIHYVADLLSNENEGKFPTGNNIKCLDIGTGANCIYPIIGTKEYGWSFIGSDIDIDAINSAKRIIEKNSILQGKIELRLQNNPKDTFIGIIQSDEYFDLSICNPPFHSSNEEAQVKAIRKLNNLKSQKISNPVLNFGGQNNELWCDGGEVVFVKNMINQSRRYLESCLWFTTIISKKSNLKIIYKIFEKIKIQDIRTITMEQGNKISRIVAWTFLSKSQRKAWVDTKWNI